MQAYTLDDTRRIMDGHALAVDIPAVNSRTVQCREFINLLDPEQTLLR
jgi:hypothetical protein